MYSIYLFLLIKKEKNEIKLLFKYSNRVFESI